MIILEGRRSGTRGSGYAYVLIGNELVHVSEVGRLIKRDGDVYIYEVPDNVAGYVYFFEYSNQGYSYVSRCPPGNYEKPDDFKRCDFELLEKIVSTWLSGLDSESRAGSLSSYSMSYSVNSRLWLMRSRVIG